MTEASATAASAAPAELPDEISLEDARDLINSWDNPDAHVKFEGDEPEGAEEPPPKVQAKQESASKEEDAAQPEEAATSDETQKDAPDEPTRELPRSWTKDKSDLWAKLDPEIQDYLLDQDSKASKAVRQSQNEMAEAKKALDARLAEVDKLRTEYDGKLPTLVKTIEDALQAEFSDIQNINDVRRLQSEDPFRFQAWQVKQMELSAAKAQQTESDTRRANDEATAWNNFIQDENKKFEDSIPQAERSSLAKMRDKAPEFLKDKGFSDKDFSDRGLLKALYDHRIQGLIRDSMRLQEILSAPKAVAQKPVPTVQKPGTHRVASDDAEINALSKRLDQSGSEADGWALYEAQLKAQARRANR